MAVLTAFGVEEVRGLISTFRDALANHREAINRLNVYPVPDGDTGTNMTLTLESVLAEIDGAGADMEATCAAISHGSLMGARGNSGVILSQVLRGIASTFASGVEIGGR
ncbi:MAG: DAK2 domain-containing protein, partial [Acidimicrobiales bacterium]|nr:DAK2 domain-containing protein [Acidimicrobiales bacterium]